MKLYLRDVLIVRPFSLKTENQWLIIKPTTKPVVLPSHSHRNPIHVVPSLISACIDIMYLPRTSVSNTLRECSCVVFLVWVSALVRLDEVCEFNHVFYIVAAINTCVSHYKLRSSGRSSSYSFIKLTLRFYPSHVFSKPDKIFLNPSENIGNLERKTVLTSQMLYTRCIPLIFAAHTSALKRPNANCS